MLRSSPYVSWFTATSLALNVVLLIGHALRPSTTATATTQGAAATVEGSPRRQLAQSRDQPPPKQQEAGFLFILLEGRCSIPWAKCTHVLELVEAVRSLRLHGPKEMPVALIVGKAVPVAEIQPLVRPDILKVLDEAGADGLTADPRSRKLLAYSQSPFARTVYLDGDTWVRSDKVRLLFELLQTFELAAAFECCRVYWSAARAGRKCLRTPQVCLPGGCKGSARPYRTQSAAPGSLEARGGLSSSASACSQDDELSPCIQQASLTPYDAADTVLRGWEMQTGVLAYRRSARVAAFWAAATRIYRDRKSHWEARSSAEQGAATLALASVDVRFLPLPPSFNARPYTMYNYVPAFGFSVYHGKELWRSAGGQTANESLHTAQVVRERLLENWRTALSEAEKSLYPGSVTGFRVGERRRLR